MFTKSKKRVFPVVLLLALTFLASAFGFISTMTSADAPEFVYVGELNESYTVGQTVEIPTATVGDAQTSVKVTLPDNSITDSLSINLVQSGYYKIEYFIKKDGKIFKDYKSFVVTGNLFSNTGISTQQYSSDVKGQSGILFNLTQGTSFTYADVIDLKKLNGPTDVLFKLYNIPATVGEVDISQFTVTLTDAYDDNNQVVVRVKEGGPDNIYKNCYTDATFNGGKFAGLTASKTGSAYVDGLVGIKNSDGNAPVYAQNYRPWISDNKYGAPMMFSFTAGTQQKPLFGKNDWFGIGYDTNTNIVYIQSGYYRAVLTDLENADVYGEAFKGFTNGMVKMTITPTVFSKGAWNVLVTEVAGKKITEDMTNSFVSEHVPELNVDFGEYSENDIPDVKQGSAYSIFPATAYDVVDGTLDVKTSVYYAFSNQKKVQVPVKDGKFIADHVGVYTIVYSVTNATGISVEKTVQLESIKNDNALSITLSGEPDYSATHKAGIPITAFSDVAFNNAFGNVNMNVYAVLQSDDKVKFELNQKNGYTFLPVQSGKYDIVYKVSDYSESVTVTREIEVVSSDNAHYEMKGFFADYLIKAGRYNMDVVRAFMLDTGVPVEKEVDIGVMIDGNVEWLENSLFTVEDKYIQNEQITFAYKPVINDFSGEYFVKTIPVIDAGLYTTGKSASLDMAKFFVQTKGAFTTTANKNDTWFETSRLENGVAELTYANVLNANPFKIEMSPIVKEGVTYLPFDTVAVYLYNPLNKEQFVKIAMQNGGDGWYFVLNDQKTLKFATSWGGADDTFYVNFLEQDHKLVANTYYTFRDVTYYGTDTLAEFSVGTLMKIEMIGSDDATGITIDSLCSAPITNRKTDIVQATIDYAHDKNAGEKPINEVITLEPYASYDVFAPYVETTITVTLRKDGATQKERVYALDGTLLRNCDAGKTYQFKLSEYGEYTVEVSAIDLENSNNDASYSYSIKVVNYTKPFVTVSNVKTEYKVGDKLTFPTFTVDIPEFTWYVTVKAPDSMMSFSDSATANENPYVFKNSGTYTLCLVVYDANMNTSESYFTIKVK